VLLQSRRTNAQAHASHVAGCLKDFAADKDIQRAFYAIEYDEFVYDQNFHKSDQERKIDKLLREPYAVLEERAVEHRRFKSCPVLLILCDE